jgi:hypothetical protein
LEGTLQTQYAGAFERDDFASIIGMDMRNEDGGKGGDPASLLGFTAFNPTCAAEGGIWKITDGDP